jgi:hypothetical protein
MSELLDVDVDDLAWVLAFITADRLGRLERRQAVEAQPFQDAADGGGRNADFGGDLLARIALPAQSSWAPGGRRRGIGTGDRASERAASAALLVAYPARAAVFRDSRQPA